MHDIDRFYGRRKGRPLKKQKTESLKELEFYKIELPLDLKKIFPDKHKIWLEVGFGGGEHLATLAERNPDIGFIGAEAFMNGVASFLQFRSEKELNNVYVFPNDVRSLLLEVPDHSIQKVFVLFPDPWPKKRHHKRRIISLKFVQTLNRIVEKGGEIYLASDVPDYIDHMKEAFHHVQDFQLKFSSPEKPNTWPDTRYEGKAIEAQRMPHYLIYLKS